MGCNFRGDGRGSPVVRFSIEPILNFVLNVTTCIPKEQVMTDSTHTYQVSVSPNLKDC